MPRLANRIILTFLVAGSIVIPRHTVQAEYLSFWETDSLRIVCLRGIHATLNDSFAVAESLFSDLADRYPESPIGPLFAAGAIQAQMIDTESPEREFAFSRWRDLAIKRGEKLRDDSITPAEAAFALGVALGYDAVYESRWGGWFAAMKKGLRAKNRFAEAWEHDSTFADALFGLGNYNYWKAAKTDFINWLPVVPDNREKGLAQLSRAIAEGVFTNASARAALVAALLHDERTTEALAHADTLAAQFPDGKAPLWMQAQANFALYRWDEARDLYDEIERRILADGPGNYYNLIACAYFRARCLNEAGQWQDARDECHRALGLPLPAETRKLQKDKISELKNLAKKLKKKLRR